MGFNIYNRYIVGETSIVRYCQFLAKRHPLPVPFGVSWSRRGTETKTPREHVVHIVAHNEVCFFPVRLYIVCMSISPPLTKLCMLVEGIPMLQTMVSCPRTPL